MLWMLWSPARPRRQACEGALAGAPRPLPTALHCLAHAPPAAAPSVVTRSAPPWRHPHRPAPCSPASSQPPAPQPHRTVPPLPSSRPALCGSGYRGCSAGGGGRASRLHGILALREGARLLGSLLSLGVRLRLGEAAADGARLAHAQVQGHVLLRGGDGGAGGAAGWWDGGGERMGRREETRPQAWCRGDCATALERSRMAAGCGSRCRKGCIAASCAGLPRMLAAPPTQLFPHAESILRCAASHVRQCSSAPAGCLAACFPTLATPVTLLLLPPLLLPPQPAVAAACRELPLTAAAASPCCHAALPCCRCLAMLPRCAALLPLPCHMLACWRAAMPHAGMLACSHGSSCCRAGSHTRPTAYPPNWQARRTLPLYASFSASRVFWLTTVSTRAMPLRTTLLRAGTRGGGGGGGRVSQAAACAQRSACCSCQLRTLRRDRPVLLLCHGCCVLQLLCLHCRCAAPPLQLPSPGRGGHCCSLPERLPLPLLLSPSSSCSHLRELVGCAAGDLGHAQAAQLLLEVLELQAERRRAAAAAQRA